MVFWKPPRPGDGPDGQKNSIFEIRQIGVLGLEVCLKIASGYPWVLPGAPRGDPGSFWETSIFHHFLTFSNFVWREFGDCRRNSGARGWRIPQLNFYLVHWSSQTSGFAWREQNVAIFEDLTTYCYRSRSSHLWPPWRRSWRRVLRTMSKSHLKLLETNEAAREGRSSGFLEAPEAPGDGPDGQKTRFLNFVKLAFLSWSFV